MQNSLEPNFFNTSGLEGLENSGLELTAPFALGQPFPRSRAQLLYQFSLEFNDSERRTANDPYVGWQQGASLAPLKEREPWFMDMGNTGDPLLGTPLIVNASAASALSSPWDFQNLLSQAQEQVSQTLAQFLAQNDSLSRLEATFGSTWNVETAANLIASLAKGQAFPSIEVLPSETLLSQGAYSHENNTIYLSQRLLEPGNPEAIAGVLLEELGHCLDARLNPNDTPGDEGQLFAALVQGIELTPLERDRIQAEDDSTILNLGALPKADLFRDRFLRVEQSTKEILGTPGRDILVGTAENERFIGGQGADLITSGSGNDVFVYQSIRDAGDTIKDFERGKDKIDLTLVLQSFGYAGFKPLDEGYVQLSPYSGGTVVSLDSDGKRPLAARPYIYLEIVQPNQLTPLDFLPNPGVPPTITASLVNDTGASASDRLTYDPTISGQISYSSNLTSVQAQLNSTPVDILSLIQSDGKFILNTAQLAQINGGSLPDGNYTLKLTAQDSKGNIFPVYSYSFGLDRIAPNLSLGLEPNFDSAPVGDLKTTFETVTLVGVTEANLSVLLGGVSATANGLGEFSFSDQSLLLGNNVFSLSATDLAGNVGQFSQTIERLPLPVNQAPTDIVLSGDRVEENAGGAVIGNITVIDPDAESAFLNNTVTVSDNRFEVVNNNGILQLKLKNGQSLDYETEKTVALIVTATDAGNTSLTYSENFTITVADVNEAPTDIVLDGNSVDENADGAAIATISITDPDTVAAFLNNTVTVSDARFEVVNNNGILQLKLKEGQSLDYETEPTVAIALSATDAGNSSLTYSEDFTINVNDVNEGNQPLSISAALANDTGTSNSDRLTLDPTVL